MNDIFIMGPKDKGRQPENAFIINTTSISKDFGKAFSPFINQGVIELADMKAHNVENVWQFSKIYPEHANDFAGWVKWRDKGLQDRYAHRYPMGKDKKPLFAYLKGKGKLGYVEARKEIYLPAYWQKLNKYCQRQINSVIDILSVCDVWLWDFDGRTSDEKFSEAMNNTDKSLGHAFIIKKYIYDRLGREY